MIANSSSSSDYVDAWGLDHVERDEAPSRFAEAASDFEMILPETIAGLGF
jgi:hypothetical protein